MRLGLGHSFESRMVYLDESLPNFQFLMLLMLRSVWSRGAAQSLKRLKVASRRGLFFRNSENVPNNGWCLSLFAAILAIRLRGQGKFGGQ